MSEVHAQPAPANSLLLAQEPPAFQVVNRHGRSPFVIVVDHASARIPRVLHNLGLTATELARHIAWDIGALAVATQLSHVLDAPLIAQNYSRLVIDCNRDPRVGTSIPVMSEWTAIPGNDNLSAADREQRRVSLFEPYHAAIRSILDEREVQKQPTLILAQHSMTPIFKGVARTMSAAVLYNRNPAFAQKLAANLRAQTGLEVAENQPYFMSDETDFTVPEHADRRGLAYAEIELRQDLISDLTGQTLWAHHLVAVLRKTALEFVQSEPDFK